MSFIHSFCFYFFINGMERLSMIPKYNFFTPMNCVIFDPRAGKNFILRNYFFTFFSGMERLCMTSKYHVILVQIMESAVGIHLK